MQLEKRRSKERHARDLYLSAGREGHLLKELRNRLNFQLNKENHVTYLRSGVLFRGYVQPRDCLPTLRVVVGDPISGIIGSLIIPAAQVK